MKNGFLAGQPQEASQAAVFSKIEKSEMKNEFLASQLREATQPPSQLEISKYQNSKIKNGFLPSQLWGPPSQLNFFKNQKFKNEKWISGQPAAGGLPASWIFQKFKNQK